MPERTAPALSPEQLPAELVPHYAEPGTVYDDEPGALVPPGWYVLGDHGHGEGADIEIKISHAVDANGNDVSGPLAAKIASLLRAEPAAPRVPQPGDRVRVTYDATYVEDWNDGHNLHEPASRWDLQAPPGSTVEVIEPTPATEQPSEWRPAPGDRVTGQLPDGTPLTGVLTDGGFSAGFPGSYCHLDMGGGNYAWVLSATLRPADTGKESGPQAPTAGVDYCGATHPEYGECFLDLDEIEHEHGHESENGRWSVTVPAVSTDEER